MSLFTFLPIPPALGQSPFKGYLYFRLKQSCFLHGRLSVQQYHTVPRVGVHFLPMFPFSVFTLPPFGLFTQSRSVTSSLAALHPLPWPGTISAVPQGWRAGAVLPSSSLHPGCWEGTWCSILWSHIPAHAPTPPLCPAPRGVQWQLRRDRPFLVALNGICSTDPAKSYGGFPCSSRSLCPVLNSIFLMVLLC